MTDSTDDPLQYGTHVHPLPEISAKVAVTAIGRGCTIGCFKELDIPSDGQVDTFEDVQTTESLPQGNTLRRGSRL